MNDIFLEKVKVNEPPLFKRKNEMVAWGCPVSDVHNWFGYRFKLSEPMTVMHTGDICYWDFGEHLVGYLELQMKYIESYPDAPVKLHLKFAENLYELEYQNSDYDKMNVGMSPAWLQEQTIYVDEPGRVTLPRRYAFRYVKVTVEHTNVPIRLEGIVTTAVTSAEVSKCEELVTTDEMLKKIDRVSQKTLANCMQRVYEDGPKRDRRLWLGDLRLQALTDYYLFKNTDLVKKCLYLFAAYAEDDMPLPSCIHENSYEVVPSSLIFWDYSMLFAVCLVDYYEHTKDTVVVDELYHIANRQLELAYANTKDGIVNEENCFIDWCEGLEKRTSFQGVLLYALKKMITLSFETNREERAQYWTSIYQTLRDEAKNKLYCDDKKYFINKYDHDQVSVHSQVWMVLGGVVTGKVAQELMKRTIVDKSLLQVVSPYMHHYVVEALIEVGLKEEAVQYLKAYWGSMVDMGADTYWEVYVPGDFSITPYGDSVMNSCCHAWSCSPAYFIRKYFVKKS